MPEQTNKYQGIAYLPRIKTNIFKPNPVAIDGIPTYADSSIQNSKVKGTMAWEEWWEEQIYYCINGYTTGGIYIPGRFYFYLNFDLITSVDKGNHYPSYVDLHQEIFELIEHAKEIHWGIIIIKSRRKGITYDIVGGVFDYGFRFCENYRAAVVAGTEEHSEQFFTKFKLMHNKKPPELRMHLLKDTKEEIVAGWQEKTDEGYITKGTGNTIEYKVAYTSSKLFRGSGYNDIAFEEGGQFPLIQDTYEASIDCLKVGDIMHGTPYVFGTIGKIRKDMQGIEEMWHESDSYHLLRYYVPSTRMFFPCVGGYKDNNNKLIEDVPNLKEFRQYQRLGCEDIVKAEERIRIRRAELLKKKNKAAYFSYVQENPLTIEEAFSILVSNNFDPDSLNRASIRIADYGKNKYGIYELEWVKDHKGEIDIPYKVIAKSIPNEDIQTDGNYCYILHMPKTQYRNLDVAGLDSYNIDQAKTTKSLGSMVVYRCKHEIPNLEHSLPIAIIRNRPKRIEMFFDNCLKLAVLYDLRYNVLIDIGSDSIIEYFRNMGCSRYLAARPKRFDAPETQQSHNIGVKLTTYSKPRMIGIMQRDILDNIAEKCWFADLVRELQNYDENVMDTDCDCADAYGYALMQEASRSGSIINEEEMKKNNPFDRIEWKEDSNGYMVPAGSDDDDDQDPFVIIDNINKLNTQYAHDNI